MEKPYAGKAVIEESFNEIKIIIPTKANVFASIFLSFWLCGWAAGEVAAFFALLKDSATSFFLIFWLGGWTVGGFFALRTLVWGLVGKEIITITQGELTIEKSRLLFEKPKTYDLNDAKNFRVRHEETPNGTFFGRRGDFGAYAQTGTISF